MMSHLPVFYLNLFIPRISFAVLPVLSQRSDASRIAPAFGAVAARVCCLAFARVCALPAGRHAAGQERLVGLECALGGAGERERGG